ncbi:hypothetical protein EVAR_30892_1 [Eumeta japonica]|uniref:Uncharacterized protein n=1 Tax=Eumeta variegata TaxID=151549 RepID=A0A4C1V5L8_EUMVA|nr:hypothetical protein EVAR_30892_1 [Eumeta japonica]
MGTHRITYMNFVSPISLVRYSPGYHSPQLGVFGPYAGSIRRRGKRDTALDSSLMAAQFNVSRAVLLVRKPGPHDMVSGFPNLSRKWATRKSPNSACRFFLVGRFQRRLKSRGSSIVFGRYYPGKRSPLSSTPVFRP